MASQQLPDRRIEVRIPGVLLELESPREIDREILQELAERPATTGYISAAIGEQAGYVTQRLRVLRDQEIVIALERGYYEFHPRVVGNEQR